MKITIRPSADPCREVDLTQRLIEAIAQELRNQFGGDDALNLSEAERHLERIVGVRAAVNLIELRVEQPRTGARVVRADGEPAACPGCPRRKAMAKQSRLAMAAA
ncbi:MAG: hypothetical protein AMXMBFR58_20770 [Phycisphaerae bacterium]